jgi:glycosyltransferase involved in cell wall biosynthesis
MDKFILCTINSFQTLPPVKQLLPYFQKKGELISIHNKIKGYQDFFLNAGKERVISTYENINDFNRQSILTKIKKYCLFLFYLIQEIFLGSKSSCIYFYTNDIFLLFILKLIKPKNGFIIYHQFEMVIPADINFLDRFALKMLMKNSVGINLFIFPEVNRLNYFINLMKNDISKKAIIIPNSNNFQCNIDFKSNNELIVVGHVGAMGVNHHIFSYLKAINALKDMNIEFWFIGNIDDEIIAVMNKDKNKNVKVFSQLPHDQLLNYYSKMDLGVILYKEVSLHFKFCAPNKLYEYWSLGVPILGDSLDGLKDLNFEGHMGSIIDMNNVDAILNHLKNLNKTSKADKIRIMNTFQNHYSLDKYMEKFINKLAS